MAERKNPGRFTLQFSMEDPQQRRAAEILGQQGRRKSQFLTSAILQYIRHPEGPEDFAVPIGMDRDTLRRMVLEILQSEPKLSPGLGQEGVWQGSEGLPTGDEPAPDGALAAMSNTLAAFRRK